MRRALKVTKMSSSEIELLLKKQADYQEECDWQLSIWYQKELHRMTWR